ncbi:ribonuclease HII [Arcanobacterium pluranimalium]|uniref:ribonuclease HII n=1 Tax=Arcanobacterium pluranimalium TaxID=108028 RepID=UPI001956F1C8|nr:ribonuclease HII [Arcanobacterium pluranimalium]MBM7825667.1 ribonuclease HII [Arcanobacterium pluranimalium]
MASEVKTKRSVSRIFPDRLIEKELLDQLRIRHENPVLAGVDEVGRGSLAGPASVGIALIDSNTSDAFPQKLRDSKLLSAQVRQDLVAPTEQWVLAAAVGHSTVEEINTWGIVAGLRAAARRAVDELYQRGFHFDAVLLDGSHDWWSADQTGVLFDERPQLPDVPVHTVVKGDARCAVVAGASVLAKVSRDSLMESLAQEFPHYDWDNNKGYSSAKHVAALKEFGASIYHRTAWKLPGISSSGKGR